ncbi:histidine kinase A domain-containing protein [Brochothrix thermosphacta DSM 20171 = FSL F6-1036]|nr:histidine kinase A domain-containing protein [Brochothrix thermosphacta DSM 20171 = FSL F6-1036]
MKKSESLKTDLITNVSHDLRTPLTSIVTYSDLMQQPNVTLADQAAYAEVIQRKAQRMKQLIDDLFEVTKMDNGAIELNYTEVDLVALVKQSVGEYTEEFNSSSYLLRTTYPEQPIMVTIDSDKIWRVIDNLLQNTLKYTLPQSRIYVTVQDEMNQSRIIIKNISNYELNEAAPLLIERFKRGEQEKARDTEGHGLGLAIVQSIVSLHQGQLIVTVDGDMFKVQVVLPHKAAQESQFGL